jgi:uracil-DNA glycosylase
MQQAEEFKSLLNHVKRNILADMEMGLEPPLISRASQEDRQPSADYTDSLSKLERQIGDCKKCKLHLGRTRLVFGEGAPKARLLFIGEGPGQDEDLAGRPFVGEAGKLLTKIIEGGLHLKREDVYICNIVKCRPPDNRTPEKDEIEACTPFLREQIRLIGSEVICTLGRTAAQGLLGREFKITEQRGKWQSYLGIPVMPTYHPAYILRNSSRERELKAQVWDDIKKIMVKLGLEVKR